MFDEFDPLAAKQAFNTEVAINALKREIRNILDSYVGWFDPFAELIQNGLDSIEERLDQEEGYLARLRIIVSLAENSICVSENGTGLTKQKYEQFLAPSFSFKSGNTRGHKGVGATFVAYGFNYIQICTKTPEFTAVGRMTGARDWLSDENPAGNPVVAHDPDGPNDPAFDSFDRGVSITLRFDQSTRPGNLAWLRATNATQWLKILKLKTGIGAIFANPRVNIEVEVVDENGNVTRESTQGAQYLWPHETVRRSQTLENLQAGLLRLFEKHGPQFRLPGSLQNLDAIFGFLSGDTLRAQVDLDEAEAQICDIYHPDVYFCYMFSAKVWSQFNEDLGVRQGQRLLEPGIQIAANNMPQGEVIQIPLRRNVGRQNQMHVVVHLRNCRADLGRKGFQKDIVEFCQAVARKLIEGPLVKVRGCLRPVTGARQDLIRQQEVEAWKQEFTNHENESPLVITNPNFFLPTNVVSITSTPTREQDVIALFNQMLAGGVIRGIRIMSTNERFTYDSMFRVIEAGPIDDHVFNPDTNPLGILPGVARRLEGFRSNPKILEYKFSLDALIEDLESGAKNSNDIDLVVVWEAGSDYQGNYHITSLLDPNNLSDRQYHGVTHILTSVSSGQHEMDLIVLSELIRYLNDPETEIKAQRDNYESEL